RKGPGEGGTKEKGVIGFWGEGGFRSRTIQGARDRSNRKGPAEAGPSVRVVSRKNGLWVFRSWAIRGVGAWFLGGERSPPGCCRCCRRFEPQAQRRRQSTRATMEHGHAGGNLHAAAGSGSAGSQRSGHPLAVRPDHVTGCEGVLTRAATSPRLPSARPGGNLGHVRMPLPDSPAQDG